MKRTFYLSINSCKRLTVLFLVTIFVFGVTAKAQPYTAFTQASDFPSGGSGGAAANQNDPGPEAIETGVKFKVSQGGVIHGVWFYRGTSNTGTHVGQLWNAAGGAPLATVSVAGGASGWLYLDFASDYTVTAGVVYIASVYMPTGTYAVSSGGLSGPIVNNGIELLCDCNPGNPGNGVFDYTTTGALTTPPSQSFGASNYWIDVSFSPFFPLSVNLSDLKATTINKDVVISWKTSSETNNRGFELQRSNNNADWYAVNFVTGAGESSTIRNYSYTDKGLAPGQYYYRLNQKDFDGKSKVSPVVTATVSGKGTVSLFQNSPNPFSASTTIRFDLPGAQKIRLSIFDMAGREIKVLADKLAEPGSHLVSFTTVGLSRQLYYIRLKTADGTLTRKILVQ